MNRLTPEQLAVGVQDLPSLPAVVMELLSSIEQEDIDISVLAKKVSYDQALTAKTLRLANSSTYGLQVKVTTIQQAITFLGFQTTRNLITAAAITGCFPSGRCVGFHDKGFWRHSRAGCASTRTSPSRPACCTISAGSCW
jgi:HD-like signal output (HDOD) protein